MASEEQNNITDWKTRLDAMEYFDGEPGVDKTAAWEKVQRRLYGKQGRKKTILFWAAAACAGLIIVFVTMRTDKKPLPAAQFIPVVRSATVDVPPVSEHPETERRVIVSGKKRSTGLKVGRNFSAEKIEHKLVSQEDTPAFVRAETSVPPQMETKTDSSANPMTGVLIQKRLPVVHINELEEDSNADGQIANEQRDRESKIRIKNGRKWTKRSLAISGSSSGHLKIEISLNN